MTTCSCRSSVNREESTGVFLTISKDSFKHLCSKGFACVPRTFSHRAFKDTTIQSQPTADQGFRSSLCAGSLASLRSKTHERDTAPEADAARYRETQPCHQDGPSASTFQSHVLRPHSCDLRQ